MAWNRPSEKTVGATSSSRPSGRGKMPCLRRGLIAGAIVVLCAGLAAWLLTNGEAASSPLQKKERGRIKEVAHSISTVGASDTSATSAVSRSATSPDASPSATNAASAVALRKADGPYVVVDRRKGKAKSIFDCHSDHQIARLIKHVPGMPLYGKLNYDRFEERFLESLKTPIIISANDSEEDKALKKAVKETRLALKDRLDAGEDIAEYMRKTEQELQDMAAKRISLTSELNRLRKMGGTDKEDMKSLVESANKILSQKGIEPVVFPEIWYQSIKIHKE